GRCIFKLARHLKAIPALRDADFGTLRPILETWHLRALPYIATKPFVESWADFLESWNKVKTPAGQGAVETAFCKAVASAPPPKLTNTVSRARKRGVRLAPSGIEE